MVSRMKTTVDISDSLLAEAKKRAVDERKPLRALIEEGLRMRLRAAQAPFPAAGIRWVLAEGGAPAEVKDRAAMYDWMRRDP